MGRAGILMLDIVIPVHNAYDYTIECVSSIKDNTHEPFNIILVDNGSTDATAQIGATVRNKKNLGFPKAVNQGIRAGNGEMICVLNNDTIVTPFWSTFLRSHITKGHADIVSPCTNSISQLLARLDRIYTDRWSLDRAATEFHETFSGQFIDVNYVIGFALFFSRDVYNAVGGFDEQYGLGNWEDIDFCYTAKAKGFKIAIAKDVFIHHFGSITHKQIGTDAWYKDLVSSNYELFKKKWGEHVSQTN